MISLKDQACIVGIGQTRYRRGPDMDGTNLTIQLQACEAALADAGLRSQQINGVIPYMNLGIAEELAVNLGIKDLALVTQAAARVIPHPCWGSTMRRHSGMFRYFSPYEQGWAKMPFLALSQ